MSVPTLFIVLAVVFSILILMVCDIIHKNIKENKTKKEVETTKNVKNDGEANKKPIVPSASYKELLEVLNMTIEKELYFAVNLKFNFQDVKIIDFNKNLETISSHIMEALAQPYLDDLSYYHNKKWIMEYVVRRVSIYLTDYIKKHPVP